ncbi:MAG: ABC transporter substrate-binding protein [Alphaproteobacteria bacterium]|nr:ABC transporter substrate-binding protein [Alphaproteobacteria bacterium]
MKKVLLSAVLIVLATAKFASAQTLDDITFYTEEYPPYNFTENGRLTGIATEILEIAFKKHNTKKGVNDIILADWDVGYQAVLKGPNAAIYTMTKTDARTPLFKWAGPIAPNTLDVFARKDRNFSVGSENDLKRLRIAVVLNDVGHVKARELGVPEENFIARQTVQENFADLEAGRADVWIYGRGTGYYLMRKAGIVDKYEDVLNLLRSAFFVGFSLDVDDKIVEDIQEVIDEVKIDGTLDRIMAKYLN